MKRALAAVKQIEISYPVVHAAVWRLIGQVPVEAQIVIPFAPLSEFVSHEQKLLARVQKHVTEKQAQIGKPLPFITEHARKERALSMHNFIVGKWQDEILVERVHSAKRQLVVVVFAAGRLHAEILQRVVHEPEVP